MDSKYTERQTFNIKPGIPAYRITAGIVSLNLLMFFGGLPLGLISIAILISAVVLYSLFSGQAGRSKPVLEIQNTPRPSEEPDESLGQEGQPLPDTAEKSTPLKASDSLQNMRVLLLSDDKNEHHDITNHLKSWGVDFTVVTGSARAFAKLIESADSDNSFQTVLVDQSSLDMEECQFAVALRAEPLLQTLYLIHFGSSALPSRMEQLYQAGYSGILTAPLDKTLLFKALHSARETALYHHNVVHLLDHYETDNKHPPLDILLSCSNNNESRKIRKILTNAGHQTFLIDDSTQVLDALDNHHFDLAILDAEMSDLTGIDAVKLYRFAHINQPWTPFILLLNSPKPQTIQACEEADINHLVVKPVSSQRLLETVSRATDLTGHRHNDEIFDYPTASGLVHYHDNSLTLDTHQLDELKRLGKDKGFLLELINQFDKESDKLIQGLQQAVFERNLKSIQDFGHKLKDTAGNLGAMNLYRMAVRITRIKELESDFELGNLMTEMRNCRIATLGALLDHLSQGNNSAYRKE
ncbi:response regulator [Sedimenticola sp.]|uniref:response regulator n=1 Tax=Sedimenticola sp. TaxID=1940285 RepID=UPI003D0BB0C6